MVDRLRNHNLKMASDAKWCLFVLFSLFHVTNIFAQGGMKLKKTIREDITPKSVVHSGDGMFAAQNMMFRHTVSFFDRKYKLRSTVHDDVDLSQFDSSYKSMMYWGAPVEGTFSNNGKYLWVSNYMIKGGKFRHPGCDECTGKNFDHSFVYKINTWNFAIEDAVEVGSVPKFLVANDALHILVVANWTSGDIHVISTVDDQVFKIVNVGRFPRGIAIHPAENKIYVSLMGESRIAVVDMLTWKVSYIENIGVGLRHLCLDAKQNLLYVSINDEARIAKINLKNNAVSYCETGSEPRSMALSSDGKMLYVVNFDESSLSKVNTKYFTMEQRIETAYHPIGITLDENKGEVWVACYSGSLQVFQDASLVHDNDWLAFYKEIFEVDAAATAQKIDSVPPADNWFTDFTALLDEAFSLENAQRTERIVKQEIAKAERNKEKAEQRALLAKQEKETVVPFSKKEKKKTREVTLQPEKKKEKVVIVYNDEDYIIVAGSFKNHDFALNCQKEILAKGYSSEVLLKKNGFYLITCGSAKTKKEIEVLLQKVQEDFSEVWVAKRGG